MLNSITTTKEVLDQAASWPLKSLASPTPPTVPNFLAVIWRDLTDGSVYITRLAGRKLGHFHLPELERNCIHIPHHHYQPRWHSSFTEYDSSAYYFSNSGPIFIKKPRLVGYDGTPGIAEKATQEIVVLETLRRHPHSNLSEYYGCFVDDERGLVTGICLKKYSCTLGALLENRLPSKQQPPFDYVVVLDGILAAINHLHSLGIAHNDISPSNIMLDERGCAVIIDFNNAAPFGQPCRSGTPGYTNFSKVSAIDNDMFGYDCVQRYVHSKVLQAAQFWNNNSLTVN
jgi:serine/threonine protein kinase